MLFLWKSYTIFVIYCEVHNFIPDTLFLLSVFYKKYILYSCNHNDFWPRGAANVCRPRNEAAVK